jgi:hypothetical protein
MFPVKTITSAAIKQTAAKPSAILYPFIRNGIIDLFKLNKDRATSRPSSCGFF